MSGPGVGPVIDGSPSSSAEIQADRELVVYGQGIGSTRRIEVTTAQIRGRAGQLRALESRARVAAQSVAVAAAATSGTAHLTGLGAVAVDAAWQVVTDTTRRAEELADLASAMDAIAQTYDDAEAANEATVWHVAAPDVAIPPFFPWLHIGLLWTAVAIDALAHGQVLPTRHGIGMGLEETLSLLTGDDAAVPAVARRIADEIAQHVSDDVVVTQRNAPGTGPLGPGDGVTTQAPIGDLEGVVEAIEDLYPDHGLVEPGTVRIDRITAADGSQSWLVLVPGTEGDLVSDHAFDWASNPRAMLGDMTASTAVVVQAMRIAGVRPGEPVMIAGHSQGGLVAVNAANAVAGDLDVAGVLTLGSPTGLLDAPPGSEVLSLEHVEDIVPGLDDAANDVGDSWTTVERTLHTSTDPEVADLWQPGASHDTPNYADTASLVDASHDAALDGFFSSVADVLDDPDATVESSYYQGTRTR